MILGLDLRAGVCGWSLLDEQARSFVNLGVHALGRVSQLEHATLTRLDRVHGLARVVAARAPGCSVIVVERWHPGVIGELEAGVAWGSVIGVAAAMTPRPRLLTVEAERWQREVLLGERDASEDLAYAAAAHLLRGHPRADSAMHRLSPREREPAIAAAMIALYGTLRLAKSKRGATG